MALTSKAKLLVVMIGFQKCFYTLTLLVFGPYYPPRPFNPIRHCISTFHVQYDRDLKRKVVRINGQTMEIVSYFTPISHRGHLTLFQRPGAPPTARCRVYQFYGPIIDSFHHFLNYQLTSKKKCWSKEYRFIQTFDLILTNFSYTGSILSQPNNNHNPNIKKPKLQLG